MLKTSLTAGPIPSIEKLDTIARKTGLIMRKSSRFSAHGFLLALMQTVLRGNNSLNHLALGLSQHQAKPMSRQAMHQRLNEASSSFLIKRLLLEDCTTITIHKSNHQTFPSTGNGKFKTSGAKVHLISLTRSNKTEPFIPDKRHLYHDTRKRQTLYTIGIQALT